MLFVATHVYHENAAEFRENLTQVAVGLAVGDLDGGTDTEGSRLLT